MTDQQTLDVYDAKIEDYKKLTFATASKSLLKFIEALPDDAHALDLGCGPGFAAAEMARRGVKVTATDASPEMVAAASQHPGVTARCETYHDLKTVPTYHGIYANFALLHATRDDFHAHIKSCHQALFDDGILHLGLKLGHGEKRDSLGRFYTYYTRDELVEILTTTGFTVTFEHQGEEPGLAGPIEPFILIQARKNG